MNNLELRKHANDVRKGIVTAVHSAKAGHPGGSLSAADVFTFLYFEADMLQLPIFAFFPSFIGGLLCVCRFFPIAF